MAAPARRFRGKLHQKRLRHSGQMLNRSERALSSACSAGPDTCPQVLQCACAHVLLWLCSCVKDRSRSGQGLLLPSCPHRPSSPPPQQEAAGRRQQRSHLRVTPGAPQIPGLQFDFVSHQHGPHTPGTPCKEVASRWVPLALNLWVGVASPHLEEEGV